MKIKELTIIALFSAVICVSSFITIPSVVPFTLQTLAIFLCIFLLKPLDATFAVFIYILLGIIGLPVFAGFKGGIGVVAGPTGGYILGFILMPMVGFICKNRIVSSIIGLILCYALGTIWFLFFNTSGITSIYKVLSLCVLPFIIPDLLKMTVAYIISKKVKFKALMSIEQ